MKEFCYFLILITLVVLALMPGTLAWNKYVTNDDAAIYVDTAINIAEGRGFVSPINRHIKNPEELKEYVDKYGNTYQSIRIAPLFIYCISLIYKLVGFSYLHLAIHIFNILLFIIFLALMLYHLKRSYPGDPKTAWLSVLCVGLNPGLFTYGVHMETLMLLLFYVSYILHSRVISEEKPKIWLVISYSLSLALCFLSKYSAFPFILAFFIHLLTIKKYRLMLISGILATAFVFPWFILREWISDGFVVGFGHSNPFALNFNHVGAATKWAKHIIRIVFTGKDVISNLIGLDGLGLLSPFLILTFIDQGKEKRVNYEIILLITLVLFFGIFGAGSLRYIMPFLALAIPLAIASLLKEIKKYDMQLAQPFLVVMIGIQLFLYLFTHTISVNDVKKWSAARKITITESIDILDEYNVDHDDTVFTNVIGLHLFSDANIILSPVKGMTEKSLTPLLETYDAEYVLYIPDGYGAYDDIFTDYRLLNDPETNDGIKLYLVADEVD